MLPKKDTTTARSGPMNYAQKIQNKEQASNCWTSKQLYATRSRQKRQTTLSRQTGWAKKNQSSRSKQTNNTRETTRWKANHFHQNVNKQNVTHGPIAQQLNKKLTTLTLLVEATNKTASCSAIKVTVSAASNAATNGVRRQHQPQQWCKWWCQAKSAAKNVAALKSESKRNL